MRSKIALLILSVFFSVAQAQPDGLLIYQAWVRPTAPALQEGATPEAPLPGTVTGAYMTIENTSTSDYRLVDIADDFAELSMLHEMTIDSKGIARMHSLDTMAIPAGQTVMLAPGGYHAMLMNVEHDLYPDQAVTLTLTFTDSNGATIAVPVGALTTDFPPVDEPLIVANALAHAHDGWLDVTLILDNRGEQSDTLIAVSSALTQTVTIVDQSSPARTLDTLAIPPRTQTNLSLDSIFIRLTNLTQPLNGAFVLTLSFNSGKTVVVAVPIAGSTS